MAGILILFPEKKENFLVFFKSFFIYLELSKTILKIKIVSEISKNKNKFILTIFALFGPQLRFLMNFRYEIRIVTEM